MNLYFTTKIVYLYAVCFNVIHASVGTDGPSVSSPAGTFVGLRREVSVFGERRQVEKYLGIPYAEAPVGARRFQRPQLKAALEQRHDATKYGASCMQLVFSWGGVRNPNATIEKFSEDCLFLNIHKSAINYDKFQSTGLPVFVFIHGGGFVCGSSEMFNGDFLSAYTEVVVVTINYRLAVWGFLSTGNDIAPGNLGLWDQHVALKWINQNIAAFGGDPNKVTISGISAGGPSAVYQALFPKNKGLFQRAIAFAGSITCPWSYNLHPKDAKVRFGKLVGCDTNTGVADIVSCIQSKSTEELGLALNNPENTFRRFPMEFVRTIDGEFLKEHPLDMIRSNNKISTDSREFFSTIAFLTGITTNEGGMMAHRFVGVNNPEEYIASREEFEDSIVPGIAKLMYGEEASELINGMIIHEYTYWDNPNDRARVRDAFIDMSSDYVFNIHAKLVADLHSNISLEAAIYAFVFDENPSMSLASKPSWIKTVVHTDDQMFLFGYDREGILYWSSPYSEDFTPQDWELDVSKYFMTSMMNFVKSGNPNPSVDMEPLSSAKWPVYNLSTGKYLKFTRNLNQDSVKNHFCAKSYNFWFHLLPRVVEATKQEATEKSYFSPKEQDNCSSEDQCGP